MTSLLEDLRTEYSRVGFQGSFSTFSEFWSWLRRLPLTFTPERFAYESSKHDVLVCGKTKLIDIVEAMNGSFGRLFLAYSDSVEHGGYCFLKISPGHQQSLFVEGVLQIAAHVALRRHGFSSAVPRVLKVLSHPTHGTSLLLERIPNSKVFSDYLKSNFLWGEPSESNDSLLLNVIVQVATFMAILESELRMNHRDLKGTNVLLVAPVGVYQTHVTLGSYAWTLQSTLRVSIIDFGFTCIGQSLGQPTLLSAGDFLPETDFCPKEGRDLFLFLASLWNVEGIRTSVGPILSELFHSWLKDSHDKCWATWLKETADTSLRSMYLLTNSTLFSAPASAPLKVLQDISRVAPGLLEFSILRRPPTPHPLPTLGLL